MKSYNLRKAAQKGFTMIELIIVIAILGILAALAIPRFGSFTGQAKDATRLGVVGAVNSAISIAHAQWVANGSTGNVQLEGSPIQVGMNGSGYPDIGVNYSSQAGCQNLMNALMATTAGLFVDYDSSTSTCTIDNASNSWSTRSSIIHVSPTQAS